MCTLSGPQSVDPIRLGQVRVNPSEGGQMFGDRGGVATGDGPGERGLTTLQGIVQRRPGQRPDDAFGDATRLVINALLAK